MKRIENMDTMDFPFDGRMDRFKDVTCCTCPFRPFLSLSLSIKKRDISRCGWENENALNPFSACFWSYFLLRLPFTVGLFFVSVTFFLPLGAGKLFEDLGACWGY